MGQALLDLVNYVSSAKDHCWEGGEGWVLSTPEISAIEQIV